MNIEPNAIPIDKGRYWSVDFEGIKGGKYYLLTRFNAPSEKYGNLTLIGQDFYVEIIELTYDSVTFLSLQSRDLYLDDKGKEVYTRWRHDETDELVNMGNYEILHKTQGFTFTYSRDEIDSHTDKDGTHIEVYQIKIRHRPTNSILSTAAKNKRNQIAKAAPLFKAVEDIASQSKKETFNRRLHMLALLRNQGGGRHRKTIKKQHKSRNSSATRKS